MTRHLKRLARLLVGRDRVTEVESSSEGWFAARSEEAESGVDLDLFDTVWHPLINQLLQVDGVDVLPGGDVMHNGRVVGSHFASLVHGERSLYLVDSDEVEAQEALNHQGQSIIAVSREGWSVKDITTMLRN